MTLYQWIESPLGSLLLTANSEALTGLFLQGQKYIPTPGKNWQHGENVDIFQQTQTQLEEYFTGRRQSFDLPLNPQGSDFQQQVWHHLGQIPFGETRSYQGLAEELGKPNAARAVGAATGRNPVSIIVPCHRVVASSGKLTGYAGGLNRKQWLLQHERGAIASVC